MQRVLSFQMARNIGESSEYITKRLCFSFLFSVGFLCLLCGFLLGRFAAERSMEAQMQKTHLEFAGNGLQNTEHLQQLTLQELEKASFNYGGVIDWKTPNLVEANMRRIKEFFSNLSFIHEVIDHVPCVRATVRGSREPDRYVILSTNGDGIAIGLELAQVLDRIHVANDWRPRRSLVFCMSPGHLDACSQTLSNFIRPKIVSYVALYVHSVQAYDRMALFGSDIMRSIAVEVIKTVPSNSNWTYLEHVIFGPRLSLNIPQVIFSLEKNDLARSEIVSLAQIVSQTLWRLSESIIIRWDPQYFNETVSEMITKMTNYDKITLETIEKLKRVLRMLLAAVKNLNTKINATKNSQTLDVRIWNDLLLDLDRALLCSDNKSSQSKTDLAILRKLSLESTDDAVIYLNEMIKCYDDVTQILLSEI